MCECCVSDDGYRCHCKCSMIKPAWGGDFICLDCMHPVLRDLLKLKGRI